MPRGVSLERTLQWMLGTLVTLVLLAITATGAWVGREATVQLVASRLEHDGEAIIAAVDIDAGREQRFRRAAGDAAVRLGRSLALPKSYTVR